MVAPAVVAAVVAVAEAAVVNGRVHAVAGTVAC